MFRRRPSSDFVEIHSPSRDSEIHSLGDAVTHSAVHTQRVTHHLSTHAELTQAYPSRRYLWSTYLPSAKGSVLTVGVSKPNFEEWDLLEDPLNYWSIDVDPAVEVFAHGDRHTTVDLFDFRPEMEFDHVIAFGMFGARNNRSQNDPHIDEPLVTNMITTLTRLVAPNGRLVLGPEMSGRSLRESTNEGAEWLRRFTAEPALTTDFELGYALQDRCNLIAVYLKVQ